MQLIGFTLILFAHLAIAEEVACGEGGAYSADDVGLLQIRGHQQDLTGPKFVTYWENDPMPYKIESWSWPYNVVILAFLLPSKSMGGNMPCPSDPNAKDFEDLLTMLTIASPTYNDCKASYTLNRLDGLKSVAAGGSKLMFSIGGSAGWYTDMWKTLAVLGEAGLEKWVTNTLQKTIKTVEEINGVTISGIDLDYEDSAALGFGGTWSPYNGTKFMIDMTNAIYKVFGKDFLITHAPQSPYMCTPANVQHCSEVTKDIKESARCGKCGCDPTCHNTHSYLDIYEAVGDKISWFNVQYYNTAGTSTMDDGFVEAHMAGLKDLGWDTTKVLVGTPGCKAIATSNCGPGNVPPGGWQKYDPECFPGCMSSNEFYADPARIQKLFADLKGKGLGGGGMTWHTVTELIQFGGKAGMGEAMMAGSGV